MLTLPVSPFAQGCLDGAPSPAMGLALDSALEGTQNLDYADARRRFQSANLEAWPLARYFRGLLELQATEDQGDTTAFYRSDSLWPRLMGDLESQWKEGKSSSGLATRQEQAETRSQIRVDSLIWGLSAMQWAGTQQKLGHSWRSVKLGVKARKHLQAMQDCPEAQAALALLNYYRDQILPRWFPMTTSPEASAQALGKALRKCRRLQPLLLNAWIWTQFDHAHWDAGLTAIDGYLQMHPNHRLFLQMRGDFLYRQGNLEMASAAYQKVFSLYPTPNSEPKLWEGLLPVGYLACVGNLARIEAGLNHQAKALAYLDIWEAKTFVSARPWLPASLKSALTGLREQLHSQPETPSVKPKTNNLR